MNRKIQRDYIVLAIISFLIALFIFILVIWPWLSYCPPNAECIPISIHTVVICFSLVWLGVFGFLVILYHLYQKVCKLRNLIHNADG